MYRTSTKSNFKAWPYSLATAVSHGGRILIQLPPQPKDKIFAEDDPFIKWLLGGATTKGRTATHGIQDKSFRFYKGKAGGLQDKLIAETKGWGSAFGMQHMGLNIALGGQGNRSPYAGFWEGVGGRPSTAQTAKADGRHGHVYLGYLTGSRPYILWGQNPPRGLLIGVEGSSPLLRDVVGHYHGPRGGASVMKVAGGIKWKHLTLANKPGEHDCMFVNLGTENAVSKIKEAYSADNDLSAKDLPVEWASYEDGALWVQKRVPKSF